MIMEYNPKTDEWDAYHTKLPHSRSSFAAAATQSKALCGEEAIGGIYVVGGSNGKILSSCVFYNFATGKWEDMPDLFHRRQEHGLSFGPDGRLYVVGGFDGKQSLAVAERYDPINKSWEELPPLKTPRKLLGLVSMADGIYAIGGHNGKEYLKTVERFDYTKNAWLDASPMKHARCALGAVISGDCRNIFALGGNDGACLNLVERFDIVKNVWEFVTPMKYKRSMHCAVSIQNNQN